MKVKRFAGAAMAVLLTLSEPALAADMEKGAERIITTQNGTGYTVSSLGRHVIPADDGSHTFSFAPTDDYDLTALVVTDGQFTDRADVAGLDQDLSLHGAVYPIRYESKTDAQGISVIRATVTIPAAPDSVTLLAEAAGTSYTVTASAQQGASVSAGTTKLGKGDTYTMTAKPASGLYQITGADVTVGKNRTTVKLFRGCDQTTQGYRFRVDAEGVLTVDCGGVFANAEIALQTAERQPDSDEVLVTAYAGRGVSSEVSKDIVKKGSDYTVSFTAGRGYSIDGLTLEAEGKTAYSTPGTNTVFVGTNAYHITGNHHACTVYLTDLQSDITVRADGSYDSNNLLVETSAGTGVRIEKDCGSTVDTGTDVEFEIRVTDEDRYRLDRITLRVGDSSRTVEAGADSVRVNGVTYRMTTGQDGAVHLYVTDVDQPVRVSAAAERINTSHKVTVKSSPHLSISKNTGSAVSHGKDVKFTVKPDSGYAVDTVTLQVGLKSATAYAGVSHIIVDGTAYRMERSSSGIVYVYADNIRADVTISAAARKAGQSGSGANGKIYMDRSVKSPFLVGSGSHFFPNNSMTRAEAVQMLARMTNASPQGGYPVSGFSDVPANAYYTAALDAFAYGGIVESTRYFNPSAPVTRADFAEWIYRLDTVGGGNSPTALLFYDVSPYSPYAAAVAYCAGRGYVDGYPDGTFRPDAGITRAEAAAVVNRVMGRTLASGELSGVHYADVPQNHWAYQDILIASAYQR